MPLGAGYAPAGSSSAGYGVPGTASVPINAPLPDAETGLPQTGRFIDPITKDYRFAADGRLYGMNTVPQLVQLALMTTRGASALPALGQSFTLIQEKGSNFKQLLGAKVSEALADLVNRKLVQIVSLTVTEPASNPDAGIGVVTWRDLTSGIQMDTTVGI
jgi:hypothetical protein